jgi:hypothetical protein
MKVCEKCGEEICTRDGENRCPSCEDNRPVKRHKVRDRKDREEILKSLGLTKCRGALGGTYWE